MKWPAWHRQPLEPELAHELAGYFRQGATLKIAAGLAGIPPGRLRGWLADGERQLDKIYANDIGHPGPVGHLYELCAKATAAYLMERVEELNEPTSAEKLRASSWLLERRDEDFNPASRLELTGADGGPIIHEEKAVVGLADALALARSLGIGHHLGLDGPDTRRALPPASDLLADSELDQPTAVLAADDSST